MNLEPLPWSWETVWLLVQIGVQASIVVGVVAIILGFISAVLVAMATNI